MRIGKHSALVFLFSVFFVSAASSDGDSLASLEGSLPSLIATTSNDFVEMTHNNKELGYTDQFKRMVDNDLVMPTIQFDPNSSFEFSLKTKNTVNHRKQFIDIDDKENSAGSLSNLESSKDQDAKHIQSYISQKCGLEKKKMNKLGSVNMNLESMITEVMDGVTDMENDIKTSISDQVTDTFSSLSSFFSPEYAFEQIFKVVKKEISTNKCNACRDFNKLGCDGVFTLAEAYKAPAQDAAHKKLADGRASDKKLQKDEGSILDYTFGVSCPTKSALETPSGIHFANKVRTRSITDEVKSKYKELTDKEIDAMAMETCLVQSDRKLTAKINSALSVLIGSVEMRTKTQASCVEENRKDVVILDKRLDLKDEQGKIYFSSINKKIDSINKTSQSLTNSVMDNVVKVKGLFYGKPNKDDEGYGDALTEYLKSSENLAADAVGNVYINRGRAKGFILKEDSSSNSKYLASTLVDSVSDMLRYGEGFKLVASNKDKLKDVFINPAEAESVDFIKEAVDDLRVEFENDIDFYTGRIWSEMSKEIPDDTSIYSCKKFDKTELDDIRKCFVVEKINRFQSTNHAQTCSCTEFGFSQDLITPMVPFFRHLEDEIDPDGVYVAYDLTNTTDPYERRYKYFLKKELLNYIDQMRLHVLNLKASVDFRLTTLPIEEQEEVRRLFRETTGMFK